MDWSTIITAIGGAFLTGGAFLSVLHYRENKKKKEIENDTMASSQWKELYERSEAKVEAQSKKIDELYRTGNDFRDQINDLTTQVAVLKLIKCKRISCDDRDPPFSAKMDCLFTRVSELDDNTNNHK